MNTKEFLLWERRSRDTIDVKRCYVDIAGDLVSGVLLSQIIYWHLPDEQGRSKLRVHHDDHDWLAKKRDDWWHECRISPKQFDRAAEILEKRNLIITHLYRFDGSPTKHIRIDWDGFFEALESLQDNDFPQRSKSNSSPNPIFPKGQNPASSNGKMEMDERERTITEIPAETPANTTYPPTPQGGQESVKNEEQTKNGGKPPAPNINSSLTSQEVNGDIKQSTVICENKNSGAAAVVTREKQVSESTRWRQERRREVHPHLIYCEGETPWLNSDSQFKGEFVRWVANEWMKKWTYTSVYSAEEAVISNFFNEPDKIPVRWRTYSLTFNHHYERAAQRLASGGTVTEDEKEYLENNLEAVRSPMPQTVVAKSETLLGRDTTVPALPQATNNPDGLSEWKPKQLTEEDQLAASEGTKLISQQVEELARRRSLPKAAPPPPTPETLFGRLQEMLADPVFRADFSVQAQAQKFVGENEEYAADYDDQGRIVAIYQF